MNRERLLNICSNWSKSPSSSEANSMNLIKRVKKGQTWGSIAIQFEGSFKSNCTGVRATTSRLLVYPWGSFVQITAL